MVVLRFFKNNKLIGVKEYPNDEKAEHIGKAWLKKGRENFPMNVYYFEMLIPTFLIEGKKDLQGNPTYSRFSTLAKAVGSRNEPPKIEVIFRKHKFDNGMYKGEWDGDLII